MPFQAWLMLSILVVMFALLVWDRFPSWLVFMGALTAAMTLRLAPPDALLTGFGNTAVITVAALFPMAAGMYATGAVSLLSSTRPDSRPISWSRGRAGTASLILPKWGCRSPSSSASWCWHSHPSCMDSKPGPSCTP